LTGLRAGRSGVRIPAGTKINLFSYRTFRLRTHPGSCSLVTAVLSRGQSRLNLKLAIQLDSVPTLNRSGSKHQFPHRPKCYVHG